MTSINRKILLMIVSVVLIIWIMPMRIFAATDLRADMNGDGTINSADAIYLLRHTIMSEQYPITYSGDVNGDNKLNSADAIYLLRHSIMPDKYPILSEDPEDLQPLLFELSEDKTYFIVAGIGKCNDSNIIIPETYRGLPVKGIKNEAFKENTVITSVVVNGDLLNIGENAFYGCSSLKSFAIVDKDLISTFHMDSVSSQSRDSNLYIYQNQIGKNAFYNCYELEIIDIPKEIVVIQEFAFSGCKKLKEINVPDNVKAIGSSAFKDCETLESIQILETVSEIGENLFENCNNLESINYAGSLENWIALAKGADIGIEDDCKIVFSSKELTYQLSKDWSYFIVTGSNKYATKIVVPETYDGLLVQEIGEYAFDGCKYLYEITIPKTVNRIGTGAFRDASSLHNIDLNNGITIIEDEAFLNCQNLQTIQLSDQLISIGASAFKGCKNLVSINIPDTVTNLGHSVFYECDSLISVTLGDSVTVIPDYAFYNSSIRNITFGANVRIIGQYVFSNCMQLTQIVLPNTIEIIGDYAFYENPFLEEVIFSESITEIGVSAFSKGQNLQSVDLSDTKITIVKDNAFSNISQLKEVKLPVTVITIGKSAFAECQSLQSVQGMANVKTIKEYAFSNCYHLSSVDFAEGLEIVEDYAFYYASIDNFEFPNSLNYIGSYAFAACNPDNGALILKGATYIGSYAFMNCGQIYDIELSENLEVISDYAFSQVYGVYFRTFDVEIPDSVKIIGKCAFQDSGVHNLSLGNGLTEIGVKAFDQCILNHVTYKGTVAEWQSIKRGYNWALIDRIACEDGESKDVGATGFVFDGIVYTWAADGESYAIIGLSEENQDAASYTILKEYDGIPVKEIGDKAFADARYLKEIVVPDTITHIGDYAFSGCVSLTKAVIGNGLKNIDSGWFGDCPLEYLDIGAGVLSIDYNIFRHNFKNIYVDSKNQRYYVQGNALIDREMKTLCKTWSSDAMIPNDGSVEIIGTYAFYNNKDLKSITLPSSITTIDSHAFSGSALESIYIPSSVTVIPDYAFYNCKNLKELILSEGVQSIGLYAFGFCAELVEVDIPDSVIKIEDFAFSSCSKLSAVSVGKKIASLSSNLFSNCYNLQSVKLPSDLKMIKNGVFQNCFRLKNIKIPNTVEFIGYDAFASCSNLTEIILPKSILAIGKSAFQDCKSLKNICYDGTKQAWENVYKLESWDGDSSDYTMVFTNAECEKNVFLDPRAFRGNYGYDYLGTLPNGSAMQKYYDAYEEFLFWSSVALDRQEPSYSSYGLSYDEAKSVTNTIKYDNPYWILIDDVIDALKTDFDYFKIKDVVEASILQYIALGENETSVSRIAMLYYDKIIMDIDYLYDEFGEPSNSFSAHSIVGVFDGSGVVCEGYAKAFQLLLNYFDIPNIYVEGGTNVSIVDHAWNLVQMDDGDWYWFDLTWGDSGLVPKYNWFAQGNSDFLDTHEQYKEEYKLRPYPLPVASDSDYDMECGDMFTVDDITYVICGYDKVCVSYTELSGHVVIPETVTYDGRTFAVVQIAALGGSEGLYVTTNATSISLPKTIVWIGSWALKNPALTAIYVDEENKYFYSENGQLYYMDGTPYIENGSSKPNDPDEEAVTYNLLNDGTYQIAFRAGYEHLLPEHFVIPEEYKGLPVTEIYHFENCTNLVSITIPGTIKSIPFYCFNGCSNLKEVYLSEGVESIGEGAFYGCNQLTSIVLPNSLKEIGTNAFTNCEQLASISIPGGVKKISSRTFIGCLNLKEVNLSEGLEIIEERAFEHCENLASIIIPNSVTEMGEAVFRGCMSLQTVVLSDKLTIIPVNAFFGCSSMTKIVIPEGVSTILNQAFCYCTILEEVEIPSTVILIEAQSFGHTTLQTIRFNGTKAEWNNINKKQYWNFSCGFRYVVECSDGTIY